MQRVTLHDIKDALFDGMSQLVDTGLLLDHRLSVTSCQLEQDLMITVFYLTRLVGSQRGV